MKTRTFSVYSDPGHAWVKVPKAFLRSIGVTAALLAAGAAAQAGFAWPRVGSSAYCDARAMGLSHREAGDVMIQRSSSPTVRNGSPMDRYNAGRIISLIKNKCPDAWSEGGGADNL